MAEAKSKASKPKKASSKRVVRNPITVEGSWWTAIPDLKETGEEDAPVLVSVDGAQALANAALEEEVELYDTHKKRAWWCE
jgi:hypothetical protein